MWVDWDSLLEWINNENIPAREWESVLREKKMRLFDGYIFDNFVSYFG